MSRLRDHAGLLILLFAGPLWVQQGTVAQDGREAFQEICFSSVDRQATSGSAESRRRWLRRVPGHNGSIQPISTRDSRGLRINGLIRLLTAWTDDTLLRLQLRPEQRFALHLFHGNRGVTLLYDAQQRGWTAYVTDRLTNAPRPNRLTLAATDDRRASRSEFGEPVPVGLHFTDGELVLTRGDVVLLGAPFPGVPQEIYLDGRVEFQAADLTRCAGLPTAAVARKSEAIDPASLNWTPQLDAGAEFDVLDTGSVRLSASQPNAPGWVTAPIAHRGPRELVVRLDHVSPGSGLFLASDARSEPRSVIQFMRNRRDGRLCVLISGIAQGDEHHWDPFPEHAVPYANNTLWLRLVVGAGSLRWWVSSDGHHWAEAEQPMIALQPRCTRLGLCFVPGAERRHIELGLIEVRSFKILSSYCAPDLLTHTLAVIDELPIGQAVNRWTESVAELRPSDVDAQAWKQACTIAALGAGCSPQLGVALLNRLMDQVARERWPVARQLDLLDEVGLLADSRSITAHGPSLPTRYFRAGYQAWRREGLPPLSSIRTAVMDSSLDRFARIAWTMDGVVRAQLVDLIYRRQWSELREQCRILSYYGLFQDEPLVVWSDQLAASRLESNPIIAGPRVPTISWRTLLSEESERDVYNQIAELDWLLNNRSWKSAARHISNAMANARQGVARLVPDDPSLLVSAAAAVSAALQRYPELAAALEEDSGELVQLRVERAIQRRQMQIVAQLARQFPGLTASHRAHGWLADQMLARGQAEQALRYYRRAAAGDPSEISGGLLARMSIAAALTGEQLDQSLDSDVELGDVQLSPAELTHLTDELSQRPSTRRPTTTTANRSLYTGNTIRIGRQVGLRLAVGTDPDKEVLRGVNRFQVDWSGRQLAVARADDLMLVHNRFELAALDWKTGRLQWISHPTTDKKLRSRDWPLIPMYPLVHAGHVMARHLSAESPQLACWDIDSGQLLWTSDLGEEIPISDPFSLDGQPAVLTMAQQRSVTVLHLQLIAPQTGQPVRRYPLLRVHDHWWERASCQVHAVPDRLYAVLGGLSFCCDREGNLHWVRSSQATPPDADPTWIRQVHQPPLVTDMAVILAQVGVRAVEAVDPDNGVLLWRTVTPDVERVLGITGNQVIVKSPTGLAALDIETGKLRWEHDDTQLLLAAACNTDKAIVYTRSVSKQDDSGKSSTQLVRLDATTGDVHDSFIFDELSRGQPRLGPLVVGSDRGWAFFGSDVAAGQWEMVELVATEEDG